MAFIARFGFAELLKEWVARPRMLPDVGLGYSFPSGHATFFFALATYVYVHDRRTGSLFFALAFAVSAERLVSGAHYLSDVLAGAVLGIVVAYSAVWILRFYEKAHNFRS